MNYFAHGMRFVDRPYFLAGTALPDWLSVADRQVRLRARRVLPFADASGTPHAELAAGVLQHLHDDAWFHSSQAFAFVTGELTRLFRELLPGDDGHRPSFLGHIVAELILDGILIARNPEKLSVYYDALSGLDPLVVQQAVNQMARHSTDRLAHFIRLFREERFLEDYRKPDRLLFRLNQVMRRVKLNPLPPETAGVLETAWGIVETHAGQLLPGFDLPAANPLEGQRT